MTEGNALFHLTHHLHMKITIMHRITILLFIGLLLTACDSERLRSSGIGVDNPHTRMAQKRNQGLFGPYRTQEKPEVTSDLQLTLNNDAKVQKYGNLWNRVRDSLVFNRHIEDRVVQEKIRWYSKNQEYLDRVAGRATLYLYYITTELAKRKMPLDLALLPVVESAYNPFAYSPSRASGIWQFIPATGKRYGLKQNWWFDGRRDIIDGTRAALDYLEKLNREFGGDWLLTLAAYNTGERNVARAVDRNRQSGKRTDFWSLRLHRETQGYVPSLLAIAEILANPEKYGIKWQPIPDTPYFGIVETGSQIDLAMAAELADMSMDELYLLNPGFNQWATDPEGPHRILVALEVEKNFQDKLATLSDGERMRWDRHIVKKGETLGQIATNYKTTIAALQQVNNLHDNLIPEGGSLLIPLAQQPQSHYTLSLAGRGLSSDTGESPAGLGTVHTVRQGDTLWDIGRKYGVTIAQLTSWNGINSSTVLRQGQKLKLGIEKQQPKNSLPPNPGRTLSSATASTPVENVTATSYTVRPGDSLWLIARRNNTTVSKLASWNALTKNTKLQLGQVISLQAPAAPDYFYAVNLSSTEANVQPDAVIDQSAAVNYIVKKGDSLWNISKRFGITVALLRKWNNLNENNRIHPGQKLILYTQEA